MKGNWIKSEWEEELLKSFGLKWHIMDLRRSQWDRTKSLNNNARIGAPLDDDKVEEIAVGLKGGSPVEMPVFFPQDGRYSCASGNHRTDAAFTKLGFDSIRCYVIDDEADPGAIQEYIRDANARVVNSPSRKERLEHVKYLIEVRGITIKEAARRQSLPAAWVTEQLRGDKTASRLQNMGIPPTKIGESVRRKLGAVAGDNDNILAEAGSLLKDFPMTMEQSLALLERVRKEAVSEDRFKSAICEERKKLEAEAAERKEVGIVQRSPRPLRQKFLTQLSTLLNTVEGVKYPEGFQLEYTEVPDVLNKVETIRNKLRKFLKQIVPHVASPSSNGAPESKRKTADHKRNG